MSDRVTIRYERQGDMVRLTLRGLSNHELRAVLVGLWARLDREDREDHIYELRHYLAPGSRLSPLSQAIRDGDTRAGSVDVAKLIEQEMEG